MPKKSKPKPPPPSEIETNIARAIQSFCELDYSIVDSLVSQVNGEYAELVKTAEDAVEYLESVMDLEARLDSMFLKRALRRTQPPIEISDNEPDTKFVPDSEELQVGIEFLSVVVNEVFFEKLGERMKIAEPPWHTDTVFVCPERINGLLQQGGFKWSSKFIENKYSSILLEALKAKEWRDQNNESPPPPTN
jgi:hypothetical protein